jgi:Spy/CpxP family protein refolding chaperone
MSRILSPRTFSRLSLAAVIAATSTLALAQPMQGRQHADPAAMQQRMAARYEQHMANLKALLKITPEQEAAWKDFTASMQPTGPQARMSRAEIGQLTAPERAELMQQRAAVRDARMQQRGEAVKAFYAQLTPEQQKAFDQHAQKMRERQGSRDGKQR